MENIYKYRSIGTNFKEICTENWKFEKTGIKQGISEFKQPSILSKLFLV